MRFLFFVGMALGLLLQGEAPADLVRLKNGGELRGSLVRQSPTAPDADVTIVSQSGATVTVPRSEIESIQVRSPLMEEYITRSREIPHTAEAHQQLAEWCASKQLRAQREEQLELLLELQPDNEQIHRLLGHVLYEGVWMSRDDAMTKQGFVKHKGKWITLLEMELLGKTEAERAAEQVWYPKVKQWVTWIGGRDARRIHEGVNQLRAIRDPDAVSALWNYLGQSPNADYRRLFVEVAGEVKGLKPVRRLSQSLLSESNKAVFELALGTIDEDQKIEVVKYCLPGLKDASNDVVQRAAIVVGQFGDERVIPDLIDALITSHRYKVQVPDASNQYSVGISANGTPSMLAPGTISNVPGDMELLYRLSQSPFGYSIENPQPQRMRTVTVKADLRNSEVLRALKQLTQKDFGYDQHEWQRWWAVQKASS
ncbi:MAG: HEAT repeat domain-containing protein [Planctomycetaceae bacterium]